MDQAFTTSPEKRKPHLGPRWGWGGELRESAAQFSVRGAEESRENDAQPSLRGEVARTVARSVRAFGVGMASQIAACEAPDKRTYTCSITDSKSLSSISKKVCQNQEIGKRKSPSFKRGWRGFSLSSPFCRPTVARSGGPTAGVRLTPAGKARQEDSFIFSWGTPYVCLHYSR